MLESFILSVWSKDAENWGLTRCGEEGCDTYLCCLLETYMAWLYQCVPESVATLRGVGAGCSSYGYRALLPIALTARSSVIGIRNASRRLSPIRQSMAAMMPEEIAFEDATSHSSSAEPTPELVYIPDHARSSRFIMLKVKLTYGLRAKHCLKHHLSVWSARHSQGLRSHVPCRVG